MRPTMTMRPRACALARTWMLTALLLAGCPEVTEQVDPDSSADAHLRLDKSWLPDGYKLWPCKTPGMSCNAHDKCAIDPVCGEDNFCYPRALQDCTDTLECTIDRCAGMGICNNEPKVGHCVIAVSVPSSTAGDGSWDSFLPDSRPPDTFLPDSRPPDTSLPDSRPPEASLPDAGAKDTLATDSLPWVASLRCFKKSEKNPADPCQICNPPASVGMGISVDMGISADVGISADGGGVADAKTSDIGSSSVSATKWSPATGGTCNDAVACTKDDTCVNGICKGTYYGSKCQVTASCGSAACDGKGGCIYTVQSGWCLISGSCYQNGQQLSGQTCATCTTSKTQTAWTLTSGTCLIDATCYNDLQTDSTGCLRCEISKSTTKWIPVAGAKTVTEDFEKGTTSTSTWTISNTDSKVGWTVANTKSATGTYALYYGDPAAGNFDSGATNSGTASMPAVTLSVGKKAGLSFMLYMDTESSSSYDVLTVYANGTQVWKKGVTQTVTQKQWQLIQIDLSSLAGTSVVVKFEFDTKDSISNSTEGVYIDDINIYHNC